MQNIAFALFSGLFLLVLGASGYGQVIDLPWDNGEVDTGGSAVAQPSAEAGDYVYRINTRAADVWRTRLNVNTGEASLYLRKGAVPVPGEAGTRQSELNGSDGLVLATPDFAPGEDWYILVRVIEASNSWTLTTGVAHVRDLGMLPFTDSNNDGSYTIGEPTSDGGPGAGIMPPEGVVFYRVSLPPNVPAWALWLNGGNQTIGVRKSKLPVLFTTAPVADRRQAGNLLLVPPYLGQGADSYFVSVAGAPGSEIHLDSRIQTVNDMPFDGTVAPFSVSGSPYRVFRVIVPVGQSVWNLSLARLEGDPSIAVKKETVPSETENDGVNEAPGEVDDNISLVAPYLTNGTWFVTVYGNGAYETGLRSGVPVITDLGYRDETVNDEPANPGWRYYRVPDFASQVGTLGWQLTLTGAPDGTSLAIRRAQVPGIWQRRTGGSNSLSQQNFTDASSQNGLLQRVDHEADIWYVGVYHPTAPLGNYRLVLNDIVSAALPMNDAMTAQTGQMDGEWRYFRVVIPDEPGLLGWYLDLVDVTGDAAPKIHVRRDRLPPTSASVSAGSATWPSGAGWTQDADFTGITTDPGSVAVGGQRFLAAKGAGRPLVAGTYYVGVLAGAAQPEAGSVRSASYTLRSRGIGEGYSIPVEPLDLAGGSVETGPLNARDFRLFSVVVPPDHTATNWVLSLVPSIGDLLVQARRDSIPDFFSTVHIGEGIGATASSVQGGKRMKRPGSDVLNILPAQGATAIVPGIYYLAVVSEGIGSSSTAIGSGEAMGTLTSVSPAPAIHLGSLTSESPLVIPFDIPAGDMEIFRFTLPDGMKLVEAELTGREGNPGVSMVSGSLPPVCYPGTTSGVAGYGWSGGQTTGTHPVLVSQSDPAAGDYTVVVRANPGSSQWMAGTGTLTIRAIAALPELHVVGGTRSHTVTDQTAESWRFFQLHVPENPDLLGIRVTLKNVTSGVPRMVIRKGTMMPKDFTTTSGIGSDSANWADDQQWAQSGDFTGLQRDSGNVIASGRYFLSAYKQPMGPGTYIIGVTKDSSVNTVSQPNSPPMSYTVMVEGIGDGMDLPVEVVSYDMSSGPVVIDPLPEREIRFFRIDVPPARGSWRMKLRGLDENGDLSTDFDGCLAIRAGRIPAFDAGLDPAAKGGAVAKMPGQDDHWTLLPSTPDGLITAGTYFVAVTAMGQTPTATATGGGLCAFEFHSNGELPITPLSALSPDVETSMGYDLGPAELAAYDLIVPERGPGLTPYGLILSLLRDVGVSNYSLHKVVNNELGFPIPPGTGSDGFSGGLAAFSSTTNEIQSRIFNEIEPGLYRVIVRSSKPSGAYGPATGSLQARLLLSSEIPTLPFDGGNLSVTNAGATTDILQYRVVIPDDPKWRAWGVRIDGPVAGKPAIIVRRGMMVTGSSGTSVNSDMFDWPNGHIWVQGDDFTKLKNDPEVASNNPERDRSQQFFMASRERPLQPGTYYIGIDNRGTTTISPRTFTLRTFAVGDGYSIPVTELGSPGSSLPIQISTPRMPAVFKVSIPPMTQAWSLGLEPTLGDMTLRARYEAVPDPVNDTGTSAYLINKGGLHVQKSGGERITLLPRPGSAYLEPGDYYFMAVSEGQNSVISSSLIGLDEAAGTIINHGPLAVQNLGTVSGTGLTQSVNLDAAEVKLFSVDVPEGLSNVQFRLNNREGVPGLAVLRGDSMPAPWLSSSDVYGLFGGETSGVVKDPAIVNFGNPPAGSYIIAVRAGGNSSNYPAASATLSVDVLQPQILNFAEVQNATNGLSHVVARNLVDKERVYYKVPVPAAIGGENVLGWLLTLDQGSPSVKIYRSETDFGKPALVSMIGRSALIVPPLLTFNTNWFIEVEGVGNTDFVLRSDPVSLTGEPWVLPSVFNELAGDSNPGAPDGQGIRRQLQQDGWEFYTLDVPQNNLGLLRLVLEQYTGNPNVYVRHGAIPTMDHTSTGTSSGASLYQYRLIGTTSEVGNFSDISDVNRAQTRLTPGRWYVAVKSEPLGGVRTQSEYRLKAHSGVVADVDLTADVPLENLSLAAGDWRYFRFTVPRDGVPLAWQPSFSRVSGSAVAYIRDSLPPFSYTQPTRSTVEFNDWNTDARNKAPSSAYLRNINPGTINLPVPPLRPGATYFLGLYGGTSGGAVNVSSSVSSETLAIDMELRFRGETAELIIPPTASRLVRITVPDDATRLKIECSQTAVGMSLKLEQGAPPWAATNITAHRQNASPYPLTHLFNEPLASTWPFVPGQDYYLLLTNTNPTATITSTIKTMGADPLTEDEDNDGMLDFWERLHFGNLNQKSDDDFDGDGSTNLQELLNETDPKNSLSVRYILTMTTPGGSVSESPQQPHHAPGSDVDLLALPAHGDVFREWRSSAGSLHLQANPQASVTMNANVTAAAIFETSLGRALDTPSSVIWNANQDGRRWYGQYVENFDGVDAAVTPPNIGPTQFTTVTTKFNGPGTLSFRWKVSSLLNHGILSFRVNYETVSSISGTTGDWAHVTRELGEGTHVVEWRYARTTNNATGGENMAYLDQVNFVADNLRTIDDWLQESFTSSQLANPDIASLLADPDNDGLSNLLEAALGSSPMVWSVPALAIADLLNQAGERKVLLATHGADTPPENIRLELQASPSMAAGSWTTLASRAGSGGWSAASASVTAIDTGAGSSGRIPLEIEETITLPVGQQRFYRLNAVVTD